MDTGKEKIDPPPGNAPGKRHFARHILMGFFTVAPLWVTWLVFDFLLGILAGAGGTGQ